MPLKDTKGITKTITFKVTGPVTVAGCTTREKVYEDNANRSFLLYIDESKAQDEKIMEYQRKKSAGTIHIEEENGIKQLLQNTQRMLQPVTVKNPYAEQLKIPADVFRPRRTNAHYLQFIEVVTFYHQYQRRWINGITGKIVYDPSTLQALPPLEGAGERLYIETTLEDIAGANKLMKEVLLRKADELSGACRNYFEQLKQYLQDNHISTFTNKKIRYGLRIPVSTVKRYHAELQNCNYIKRDENPAISGTGKKTKAYHYEVVSYEEYRQLQERIGGVLDEIFNTLSLGKGRSEDAQQSKPAQKKSEPVKTKRVKASGVSAQ